MEIELEIFHRFDNILPLAGVPVVVLWCNDEGDLLTPNTTWLHAEIGYIGEEGFGKAFYTKEGKASSNMHERLLSRGVWVPLEELAKLAMNTGFAKGLRLVFEGDGSIIDGETGEYFGVLLDAPDA